MRIRRILLGVGLATWMAFPLDKALGFDIPVVKVTDNSIYDNFVEISVDPWGVNQVIFKIANVGGPSGSFINQIYFEDKGDYLGAFSSFKYDLELGQTLKYALGANPNQPPGLVFDVVPDLSSDADNQKKVNGINPGEVLGIIINLNSSYTFADIENGFDYDAYRVPPEALLRLAVHVQGLGTEDESDTFATDNTWNPFKDTPPYGVPDGSMTLSLLGIALLGVEYMRRKMGAQ